MGRGAMAAKPKTEIAGSKPKEKAVARPRTPAKAAPAKAPVKGSAARQGAADPGVSVRLKDLIDRVVATAGVKKKDARPVIEATLKHLGEALAAGEALILQPLGRLRVSRTNPGKGGDTLTLKLRRPGGDKPAAEGLAKGDE